MGATLAETHLCPFSHFPTCRKTKPNNWSQHSGLNSQGLTRIFIFEPAATAAHFLTTTACWWVQRWFSVAENSPATHPLLITQLRPDRTPPGGLWRRAGTFHSDGRCSTCCRGTMVMLSCVTKRSSNVSEAHPNCGQRGKQVFGSAGDTNRPPRPCSGNMMMKSLEKCSVVLLFLKLLAVVQVVMFGWCEAHQAFDLWWSECLFLIHLSGEVALTAGKPPDREDSYCDRFKFHLNIGQTL